MGAYTLHIDLVVDLMIFGLVTFAKVKLHPPSSIMRSAIHRATILDFCAHGDQIRRWHVVVMW